MRLLVRCCGGLLFIILLLVVLHGGRPYAPSVGQTADAADVGDAPWRGGNRTLDLRAGDAGSPAGRQPGRQMARSRAHSHVSTWRGSAHLPGGATPWRAPARTPMGRPGAGAPTCPGGSPRDRAIEFGGLQRHYIVHVPPGYDGETPVPVVIMLHGGGGTASGAMQETGWDRKADQEGFLAVFPDATPPFPSRPARFATNPQVWNDGSGRGHAGQRNVDDVGFISALIDDLLAGFRVNERRIFVTGHSNGASMSYRLGIALSDRIAAIAPIGGYLWLKDSKLDPPVSLIHIIGAQDPLSPLEGGEVRLPWGRTEYHPPVHESVRNWARMLACPPEPKVLRNEGGVQLVAYGPGREGSEVISYTIEGMGHVWPGGVNLLPERLVGPRSNKINATGVIWEFFRTHPKPWSQ